MVLSEFEKTSITKFRGLYARGLMDEVPPDHAIEVQNMAFSNTGETYTRQGAVKSLNLVHPVKRMFLATPLRGGYFLLTTDGTGRLYAYNSSTRSDTTLKTINGMVDFCAVNMYGKTYIQPVMPLRTYYNGGGCVYVFDGTTIRPACGFPASPGVGFQASDGSGEGHTSPGKYQVAVAFETDTGYLTRLGPVIWQGTPGDESATSTINPAYWDSPGGVPLYLGGIPTGGPGVIARHIFVTKADQLEFFFLKRIPDNSTTSTTIDFYDTDLVVSGDYLNDNLDYIPAGVIEPNGGTSMGLFKYHGRLMAWGNSDAIGYDKILVSEAGDPETFNTNHSYIQMPTETDGNIIRSAGVLRDTLYLFKAVGIFSTQDNLDNPVTWPVVRVDGGSGAWFNTVSTLTASQTALPMGDVLLAADISGLYLFNGVVQGQLLTWKVQDIWDRIPKSQMSKVTLQVDPFEALIYLLFPVDGATSPSYLLVGDFSENLSPEGIKWSYYKFPFQVRSIGMATIYDSIDQDYYLRMGSDDNALYRLNKSGTIADTTTGSIDSFYRTGLVTFDSGKMNIFRALTIRMIGAGKVQTSIAGEDEILAGMKGAKDVVPPATPKREYTYQINYTSEKLQVMNRSNFPFTLNRIDVYGKVQFDTRPM